MTACHGTSSEEIGGKIAVAAIAQDAHHGAGLAALLHARRKPGVLPRRHRPRTRRRARPSSRASRRASFSASSCAMSRISSTRSGRRSWAGTPWASGGCPECSSPRRDDSPRCESRGLRLEKRDTPMMVPVVPMADTKCVSCPAVCGPDLGARGLVVRAPVVVVANWSSIR